MASALGCLGGLTPTRGGWGAGVGVGVASGRGPSGAERKGARVSHLVVGPHRHGITGRTAQAWLR